MHRSCQRRLRRGLRLGQTRFNWDIEKATFLEKVGAEFQKNITSEIATLRLMIEGQKEASVVEEPTLPVSADRFLTQPVRAR